MASSQGASGPPPATPSAATASSKPPDPEQAATRTPRRPVFALAVRASRVRRRSPRKDARGNGRDDSSNRSTSDVSTFSWAAKGADHLDSVLGGAVVDVVGGRGPIEQAGLALGAVTLGPLAGCGLAHFGGRGRLRERPSLCDGPLNELLALFQAESRVSVELHPDYLLGAGWVDTPSLQGGPDETTRSGNTASWPAGRRR